MLCDVGLVAKGEADEFSSTVVGLAIPSPKVALRPINPAIALPDTLSSSSEIIPASSRIRKSLNLSRKLFLPEFLPPFKLSDSLVSSSLLSISSGLLLSVAIDEAVFLRSVAGGNGGEVTVLFLLMCFETTMRKGL